MIDAARTTGPTDPAAGEKPLMMTAEDIAFELQASVRTVRRMELCGKLPRPWRIGRLVRWRRAEILDWIDAGQPDRAHWTWPRPRK